MKGLKVYLYVWLCLFGLCAGSFLNVVVARLPRKGAFLESARSRCPGCGHTLGVLDLVPLFGWLFLRGRCRYCSMKISPRYPLVEAAGAALAVLCFLRFGFDGKTAAAFGVTAILLAVALIDFDTMEIPHPLLFALIPFAAAAVWLWPEVSLWTRVIGFFAVSAPLLLLTVLIPGAFGGGDIKLIAVCGFLLGWKSLLLAFFVSLLLGGSAAIFLLLTGKSKRGEHIAFGPYICAGTALALFWGSEIIEMYLGLFF